MSTTKLNHPATHSFVTALLTFCREQGYEVASLDPTTESGLKENAGWCFLRLGGTHEAGAALIIPKGVTKLGKLDSHVDLSAFEGYIPLTKPNGKVMCRFEPDIEKVKKALPAFLSAAKRATLSPTPKATVAATPKQEPVAEAPASQEPVIPAAAWDAFSQFDDSEDEVQTARA